MKIRKITTYLTLIILLFFININSQSLKPTIGGRYTGGLSYDFEHEYFSGQVGFLYEPQRTIFLWDRLQLSGEYVYDYLQEYKKDENNFYTIRLQPSKFVSEDFALTYYIGYMDSWKANYRTNFIWGFGMQYVDDNLIAEILYEKLANYPHVSIGITFPLWELLNK